MKAKFQLPDGIVLKLEVEVTTDKHSDVSDNMTRLQDLAKRLGGDFLELVEDEMPEAPHDQG